MEPTSSSCSIQPSIVFLMLTLTVTSAASVMLCVAIMTKHWEYVTWDRQKLEALEKNITNSTSGENRYEIEWLLEGQVARVLLEHKNVTKRSVPDQKNIETKLNTENDNNNNNNLPALFFVPIHGGIWTFCINITAEQQKSLQNMGFPQVLCRNYLKIDTTKAGNLKTDWQHRMQNLSISCALVCLIILGSSALIGAFGVTKRQISAVLVTGVMYLLAAVFAIFSLSIIHFKRAKSKSECLNGSSTYGYAIEGVAISSAALEKPYSLSKISKYFNGRIFTTGWSLHLGWGGAGMCILVSVLWILLSKIMRFNPLNSLLAVM